ncbi:hypothetical protein [Alkaliphilus sp. B6464]|uniref:hypothetical protein n=1 Tax=Alkaliphilus sp. B6464 TaxID=2731219 RepID=UPI001BA7A31B|nr:hypothetical protein [Alkaliphilus sp. B6464]QUH21832.1 hypothetical protein HYG84_18010 [Alkaliphilus sp. B6464]
MDLFECTKISIEKEVKRFYYKAIESGAVVSKIEYIGANMYKVSVGKMELTYMGTVDGTAKLIGASGDIF